jgi:hypothetical protein
MISNTILKLKSGTLNVPIITRSNIDGWIPEFDLWTTNVGNNASFIDCTQNFGAKLQNYAHVPIDPEIGYYSNSGKLVIHWKAIIDSEDVNLIHDAFNGKLRGINWQKRYCTYFNTGSKSPWLHSVVLRHNTPGQVVHHINGVSVDNRKENLHILPKREHDSINHAKLEERKLMFENSEEYWQKRKAIAIDRFINELGLILLSNYQEDFVGNFAIDNIELAKEILEIAKININLSNVNVKSSKNRFLNSHLNSNYLDTYEIEKYLKRVVPKAYPDGQLRLL